MKLTRKTNIIISSLLLLLTLLLTIISGFDFKRFADYETEFILRENVITRVEKFSQYSPKLANTVGDSNIYVALNIFDDLGSFGNFN